MNRLVRFGFPFLLVILLSAPAAAAGEKDEPLSDAWMGVYLNGVKVGYIHGWEDRLSLDGEPRIRSSTESVLKVSRLGSAPMIIRTVQISLADEAGSPLETELRTLMSETETVIRARVLPDEIVFSLGGEVVKRVPRPEEFILEVPYGELSGSGRMKSGFRRTYRMLDPMAYGFSSCRFEVLGEEEILILGRLRRLLKVRSEVDSLVPLVVDEWIDDSGEVFRSDTRTGFLDTTALRMPREQALEESGDNLDLAFSTLIRVDVRIEDPLPVRRMEWELGGAALEKLRTIPWDGGSQRRLSESESAMRVETRAVIMREGESVERPVSEKRFREALSPTLFCQSDDPEIAALAARIVDGERNAWKAALRIAGWISRELSPNYDVGFASAREILANREGDCSEHTVLFVALCRASGIPARAAVGLMAGDGFFAYHMWPEVWVGRWVDLDAKWLARDAETGEYYTDATHLKLGRSLLGENLFKEMITAVYDIIGKLTIRILDYETR